MDRIPVTFVHEGKQYAGFFSPVQGAGANSVFYLTIDNYYSGRLRLTDSGWVFDPTSKIDLRNLTEEFGDLIVAWYQ